MYTLLAGTVSGLTAVALFAQSGLLISKAALMPPFYIILILTAFLKLFGVTKSASKYAERLLSHRVTFRFMHHVRVRFFDALLPQAHVLQRYKSGDLLMRITSDVETLQHFFLRVVYPPLVTLLVFFATIIFTLFFSPLLALLLLIGLLLTTVVIPALLSMRAYSIEQEKRAFTIEATEYFYGYKELLLHNEQYEKERELLALATAYGRASRRAKNNENKSYLWNQAAALFISFMVVLAGAYAVSAGDLDGVYLALLILVAITAFETAVPMASVPAFFNETKKAYTQLQNVTTETTTSGSVIAQHLHAPITIQDVHYTYGTGTCPALKNISMHIAAKKHVAIVGASGSGKTTLMQLLMQELHATDGTIYIGDIPLARFERESYYTHIGAMLQHNHFFLGTVKSNLLFAKPGATDDELQDALQKAKLIKSLDTPVLEKGSNLSGGEKQRLAFARLLLKQGDLWLVDEPFASIDEQTEAALLTTLLHEANDKTLVMITHRLTNLYAFDYIYVMEHGEIVEYGTHAQLLAKGGYYARMQKGI